ncbi:MAG: hypothetical protein R3C39_12680 [Dehalococcoidia bacterium]
MKQRVEAGTTDALGQRPTSGDARCAAGGASRLRRRQRHSHRLGNRVLVPVAALAVALEVAAYRWWHLRWGATRAEVTATMPGDERLPGAAFVATRAITVAAPPPDVWPWLLQVGSGRGGFYSYDLLDNLGRHSADEIIPKLQALTVGDWIPMSGRPSERRAFRVDSFETPSWMLWTKPDSTWAWELVCAADGATRLVTRLRCRYSWRDFPAVLVSIPLMELADFSMMRRMLLGIRHRAESLSTQRIAAR